VSHYNAPKYYSELDKRTPKKLLTMASISYAFAAIIYIVTMALGVKLFGANAQSFLLNNFAASDPLATIARIAFGSSVLASYPLIFLNMRNWFVALAGEKFSKFAGRKQVTFALLALISTLAVFFKDIGVVGSLAGGILGSSVMFIFPPIMYIRAFQRRAAASGEKASVVKVGVNVFLLIMGSLLAGFSTYNNIRNAFMR
jgi:amino acid permease